MKHTKTVWFSAYRWVVPADYEAWLETLAKQGWNLQRIRQWDSIRMTFPAEQEPIELNSADSTTLVEIRGIGPYYAAKIIRYRERLGGYYRTEQLKDLRMTYFNVDSSAHLFTVNPGLIRKKDLNTLTFKEVLRHPYLEYEDVKLIFNAKNKYKKISMDTLEKRKILPVYKLKKIKPYFM